MNECLDATCNARICGEAPKGAGTPVSAQTPGDCKVAQCDGAGAVDDANDDADLPVDGNECTDDVCTDGVASNPAVAADSPCGRNGALHCDGMGQCVDCLEAADCGTDTECQMHTCDAGVCGVVNASQGTVLAMQTAGDCKVEQCDGMGGTETAEDNADVPVDGTACTDDVCAAGVASNPPVAENTACMEGDGTLCDGDGACVECLAPSDCPGTDDECKTRTCLMGVCGFSFTAANTPLMAQTAGNCTQVVCDGAGNVTTANDDADAPNDNNPCTTDTCSMGAPVFTNVMGGTSCGATQVCDDSGQCVGCNSASDCPGMDDECKARTCNANVCGFSFTAANTPVASQVAGDCKQNVCDGAGNVTSQNLDSDTPADDGNQCTSQACSNGSPSFPPVAAYTPCNQNGGSVCSATGQCVGCTQAAQCPGSDTECQTRTCVSNTCGFSFQPIGFVTPTQTAGDCKVTQCNGSGGTVQADSNGDVPVDGLECTDDVCTSGVPSHPAKASDTPCGPGGTSFCNGATACVQCNAAPQCPGSDTECQTRTCNSNTCGFSFTAAGTPVAMQTAGDCKQNQCNGSGGVVSANLDSDVPVDGNQCTGDVCTAGVPANPNLTAGTACSQGGGVECNGSGACVLLASCSDMTKNGTETDVDCGGTTCPKCAEGLLCAVNGDCTSGVCTGGTCQAPTCSDGVNNGSETGLDCGGSCPACANGSPCLVNGDCSSNICNGSACVECVTASQCLGADTDCQARTCVSNTCGFSFAPAGTPTSNQTTGDCKQNQCNGAGVVVSANLNLDLPIDGNQCTNDHCANGVPSNPNLATGTACSQSGGTVCDGAGACVSPPNVASTTPADGTASVLVTTPIAIIFTQPMNSMTLTGQTTAGACSGSIQVSANNFASCIAFSSAVAAMTGGNTIATFTPASALSSGTTYRIRVLGTAANVIGLMIGAHFTTPLGFSTVP